MASTSGPAAELQSSFFDDKVGAVCVCFWNLGQQCLSFLGNLYLALIKDSNAVLALVRDARVIAHKLLYIAQTALLPGPVPEQSHLHARCVCVRARDSVGQTLAVALVGNGSFIFNGMSCSVTRYLPMRSFIMVSVKLEARPR